ncbi:MAG: hypothetical protein ACTSXG_02230 [Alphaproteobacteria bacterium]
MNFCQKKFIILFFLAFLCILYQISAMESLQKYNGYYGVKLGVEVLNILYRKIPGEKGMRHKKLVDAFYKNKLIWRL